MVDQMQKTPLIAWAMLIVLALIWGSSFILIKKGLVVLSSGEVGALRIVAASICLLPFALIKLRTIGKNKRVSLMGAGLLGSLIPSFLFAIAQTRLESAITGVLNTMVPIFTILIGLIILKKRENGKVFLGVFIGFIGTAILITSGQEGGLQGINAYALLVILATLCYASNLHLIKVKLNDIEPLTVTSVSLLMVGPVAALYLFGVTDFLGKLTSTSGAVQATLYISLLGVLGTAIALIIFNRILQLTDTLFTSSVTYLIPIVAVLWGIVDGEQMYATQYVGMVAVGLGVYIANKYREANT